MGTKRSSFSGIALLERYLKYASVAQLVEQLICNQLVGGSSPSTGSSLKRLGIFQSG
jgi:hypothetical protein